MQTTQSHFLMQTSFDEVFIMEAETLYFMHVNKVACANLQYSTSEMTKLSFPDILDAETQTLLHETLQSSNDPARMHFNAQLRRRDGTDYPMTFRLLRCESATPSLLIAMGVHPPADPQDTTEFGINKSLFSAIVSNTPGLVCQFASHPDGRLSFSYLSEGCQPLLGLTAEQLRDNPALFFELILPEDRASHLSSMRSSSGELKGWNWEGRIWIDAWKDIKWINLRATPHLLADGSVQWNGIMTNITQSKLEQFEIKHSRARLAELSAHIERVKEMEQTRIAREVHDDLGGNLTAIKMALARLAGRLPAGNTETRRDDGLCRRPS